MAEHETVKSSSRLVKVAAAIVIIWALRYAQEVLVPIALAVLFAFLLAPLVHRLERAKVPRTVAVLLVVLLAFGVIGGIGTIVTQQISDLTEHLPEYTTKIVAGIDRIKLHRGAFSKLQQAGHHLAREMAASQPSSQPATAQAVASNNQASPGSPLLPSANPDGAAFQGEAGVQKVQIVSPMPGVFELAKTTFGPLLSVLATAFIVIVLCIFMLMSREDLRDRVIRLVSHGHLNVTTQAMDDAAKRVSRYLTMQALTNGTYGCVVAGGLLLIGVPNALLWGLLAALLRFIPYVGPWLGAAGPILLAFVTRGAHRGFMTVGMYVALEITISSFVEPWLYGSRTGVSSIAILVAAAFWAWLWGGVGLLLATPLTVLLVVVGKYVPQLEFLSVLLGDEPVFDPPTRYYQRLLAEDPEEASELIEQYLKEMPLESVYEGVLIPAIGFAKRDRFHGRLDGERAQFVISSIKDEIRELGERPPPPEPIVPENEEKEAKAISPNSYTEATLKDGERTSVDEAPAKVARVTGAESVQILCLPARDEADELAGSMFAQLLARSGFKTETISVAALASEMIDMVRKMQADIVFISALPPAAATHARYLCKRLHQTFPEVVVVVGLWTAKGELDRFKEKICCTTKDAVVSTFAEGIQQVQQLVHPLILAKGEPVHGSPTDGKHPAKEAEEKARHLQETNRKLSPSAVGAGAERRDNPASSKT